MIVGLTMQHKVVVEKDQYQCKIVIVSDFQAHLARNTLKLDSKKY